MRGLQKPKKISWVPDANLCQERLFLSEESPSQVGLCAQDHLQAKLSWPSHSNGFGNDDILPPGFEGGRPPNQYQVNLSEIPLIRWRCPPRFQLDISWQVVAGEESREVEVENQRERRVLEAIYPRPSAIPPDSSVSMDVEQSQYDDQQTPSIPITPIEDEDAVGDTPSGIGVPFSFPMSLQPPGFAPGGPPISQVSIPSTVKNSLVSERPASGVALGVDPDVVAAASAAFTQISNSNENGSLIDRELLIKLLSNPKSIEKLVTDYGGASNAQNTPNPTLPISPVSDHHHPMVTVSDHSSVRFNMLETSSPSLVATTSSGPPFYSQANGVGVGHNPSAWIKPPAVVPAASFGPSQLRDMNYYKNLIQQHGHGGDRQETSRQFGSGFSHQPGTNQEFVNNQKSRDSNPKKMKACAYYNSARGCWHGDKCAFQHDTSPQQRGSNMAEGQNAKRMKLERQISS